MDIWTQEKDQQLAKINAALSAPTGAISAPSVTTAEADIRHGPKPIHFGPTSFRPSVGAPVYTGGATVNSGWQAAPNEQMGGDLDPLAVGDRVLSVFAYGTATAGNQWSATLSTVNLTTGANAVLGTGLSGLGAIRRFKQIFLGSYVVVGDTYLHLEWTAIGAAMSFWGAELTYDRP